MIIDAWGQHPTLRQMQSPIFESLRRWTRGDIPSSEIPVSHTLAAMDAAGVDKMLISAWQAPRVDMISNEEVFAFVEQASDRLIGIGSVDISQPMRAVEEIKKCKQEYGFKGIRVLPWLCELPPTDRRFYPVFVACVESNLPFCTQIGHAGPLMPSEVGRPIYLDQVAIDFPELTIVGGHIGYPWTEEAIAVATKHPNVYIDTSAYLPERYPAEMIAYMKGRGTHKVLFGSNYPMLEHERALSGMEALGLSSEQLELFLHKNAERVYNL